VCFHTNDCFLTEIVVLKVFISSIIFFGISVSCVKDKEYLR
jgi:hypothetical protein